MNQLSYEHRNHVMNYSYTNQDLQANYLTECFYEILWKVANDSVY
jgi:hypothetical protein